MKYQKNKGKTCTIPGCTRIARIKGMCDSCYRKYRKKSHLHND